MKKTVLLISIISLLVACSSPRKLQQGSISNYDKALGDSILAYALDHEALFTLADTLKSISSVKLLRYAVAKDSTMSDGEAVVTNKDSLLHQIERYQKVCNALSTGDWQFVLIPFNRTEKNIRNMEIYVVRRSQFQKELTKHPAFWGQWGFTASADPAVVLPVIEYETKLDRNRAYGYLFGYPDYAVDFFVESSKTQERDTAHKLVPRDFFAIPVYAGNRGYFTYAIPQGQTPLASDSTLYNKAVITLERYKRLREKYISATGLKATNLWQEMRKEQ